MISIIKVALSPRSRLQQIFLDVRTVPPISRREGFMGLAHPSARGL
jgi:hypothetical protein